MDIILASTSPRRKELLTLIGLDFSSTSGNVDEILDYSLPLEKMIEKLAYEKAEAVAKNIMGDFLVIGADTIVEVDGKVLGKPIDQNDAKEMLTLLSGRRHNVITGVSIISTSDKYKSISFFEKTEVKFKPLTKKEINNYIDTGECMDKAGSYAIQGIGTMLVEGIYGCYTNVVGLPIPLLMKKLSKHYGIKKI
ncbi:MAG: Maf family protein [Cyanobacteriota bacterium]|jgi:septum formation protein